MLLRRFALKKPGGESTAGVFVQGPMGSRRAAYLAMLTVLKNSVPVGFGT